MRNENDGGFVRHVRILDVVMRIAFASGVVLSSVACRSDPIGADADASSRLPSRSSSNVAEPEPSRTASAAARPAPVGAATPDASATTVGAATPTPRPKASGSGGLNLDKAPATGGCPCGCDRSESMVVDLRAQGRDSALRDIDEALHTIGEREDAGYITERMVQHRLRLLAAGKELGRTGPGRFTALPLVRAGMSGKTDAETRVRAELLVHGETTELVRGREKLLRASFVVRLDLENARATDVTLREPTLESKVSLPVSRWYVAGGDGQPWDGVLRAGEKKLVHAIGYAGEALPPGVEVHATIHFESLRLPATARARQRWNETD